MKTKDQEKRAQAQSWRQELESNNGLPESFEYRGKKYDLQKLLAAICDVVDRRAKTAQPGSAS